MSGPQLRHLVCGRQTHTSLPGDIQVAHLWNWRNVTRKKRYMKQFEPCVSSFILFWPLSPLYSHLQYTFIANFLLNYLDPRMGQHEKMCCKKVGATRRALSLAYETIGMMCVCCAGADIMTFWSTCSSHVCAQRSLPRERESCENAHARCTRDSDGQWSVFQMPNIIVVSHTHYTCKSFLLDT